jgi:hypothetical protein
MRILRVLLASRKSWVGIITMLLTAAVLKWVCPWLGLPPDQAALIAAGMVAMGLAVIGGIAYEDGNLTVGQRKPPTTPTVLVLLLVLPLLAGCMAPAALREAEAWEVTTWQGHLGNDQRIEQTWEQVFLATRQADIEYTTQRSIDLVKVKAATPADIEEGIKAVIAAREKALADTQLIVAKMRGLVATNQNEAAKAMKIHGAVTEWMSVGMEASAIPNIVTEAFGLVQSLGLLVTMPGIQVPTIQPAPATPAPVPK